VGEAGWHGGQRLTKWENEKQLLFHIVEMHCKWLPKATKSAALETKTE